MVFGFHIVSKRRFTLNGKERLYAAIGGIVGAVVTLAVCSFSPLGAQSQSDGSFDVVTCRELKVVDSEGKHHVFISSEEHGGSVGVFTWDRNGRRLHKLGD